MKNYILCSEWQNSYPTWRHSTNYKRVAWRWRQIRAWKLKMFHHFLFLQTVFGIVNAFSWTFDAVSSDNSCLTSMLFLLHWISRDSKVFPACWILIGRRGSLVQSLSSRATRPAGVRVVPLNNANANVFSVVACLFWGIEVLGFRIDTSWGWKTFQATPGRTS